MGTQAKAPTDYVPFGAKWKEACMRMRKDALVELLKGTSQRVMVLEAQAERTSFARILRRGRRDRGVITQADVDRVERQGLAVADA